MVWAMFMIARSRHRTQFVQSYEAGESRTFAAANLFQVAIT